MNRTRHRGGRRGFGPDGPPDFLFRFGPGGHGGPRGFGRGGRRPRGDVRAAVLLLLESEPRNGYALMQEIEERSEGAWRPSPGSMYPALSQLEDEGLIRVREGAGGSGRAYELTDEGRAHVDEHREQLGEPWKDASGGFPKEAFQFRDVIGGLAKAAAEVMRSGTDEQRERAIGLLDDARRKLYLILAEEK
jgi:DNA-binding PadR family transcriptional regulator